MKAVRFGYKASSEQFAPRELVGYGILAEECGFDSVFFSDHFQPWRHDGGHAPHALSVMSALGERTDRITIGTSVLTPTFRYHPAIVAQAFATLGCLYPRRVVLGMGTGESMNEVPLGTAWPEGRERFGRFREAVRLIRRLWDEERVSFDGEYYRTTNATIYDRPESPLPIWLAGSGPAATRFAGREGDGYVTTSGKAPSLYTDTLLPAVRDGADRAGRSLDNIEMMIEVKVSYDHDLRAAREATRYWSALALTAQQKAGIEDPIEMQRLADELTVDQSASRFIVSDDPDEHVSRILDYVRLGFNHLVFHSPGPDQIEFLRRYGSEILPRLREATRPGPATCSFEDSCVAGW